MTIFSDEITTGINQHVRWYDPIIGIGVMTMFVFIVILVKYNLDLVFR